MVDGLVVVPYFFVNQSSYIMLYFHAVLHSNNIVTTNIKIVDMDLIH